jgi:hypothetical protein
MKEEADHGARMVTAVGGRRLRVGTAGTSPSLSLSRLGTWFGAPPNNGIERRRREASSCFAGIVPAPRSCRPLGVKSRGPPAFDQKQGLDALSYRC